MKAENISSDLRINKNQVKPETETLLDKYLNAWTDNERALAENAFVETLMVDSIKEYDSSVVDEYKSFVQSLKTDQISKSHNRDLIKKDYVTELSSLIDEKKSSKKF